MTPGSYDFDTHHKGDSFQKDNQEQFTLNTDVTNATIKIQFRSNTKKGRLIKEIDSSSGITISDYANGVITIDSFIIDWRAGVYHYDIQVTFSDNSVVTYIQGTLKIKQDVTV